ncbi:hypothetical protein L917_12448 [Phytophthora nicotianae]|uniref:RxLR effector protein n=2 Tax=Phytophthora nicotianae TaxID=4792 RepID=W2R3L8_PHYN3|nr:hypothetical protein PPTG_03085 [Phytophthora nicotianae INRA-310]ETL88472.1 hypothetical protein L917_12448 [Phytophthora nicotianae]ETN19983.1 hypothetical protein PPTG_03085 [Phytophthora nicotianae INRA-310]
MVTSSNVSRLLKARDVESSKDLKKESSADESRAMPKLDRVVSDLADDANLHKSIKAKLTPMLKHVATVEKLTPPEAATKWGIWTLLKTKSMEQLANHPDYLLWKTYTKYWNKYHYSSI